MKIRLAIMTGIVAAAVTLTGTAFGQLTIDATSRPNDTMKHVTRVASGIRNEKMPLQVLLNVEGGHATGEAGKTPLIFILTNQGKVPLLIPTGIDPRDLESYRSFKKLSLFITAELSSAPATVRHRLATRRPKVVLDAGPNGETRIIHLFGSDSASSTIAELAPGQSVRVRAEVDLPHFPEGSTKWVLVAHAVMSDLVTDMADGSPILEIQGERFSDSPEYPIDTFF